MFGIRKDKEYRFTFDIDKVTEYFKQNEYVGMNYKINSDGSGKDKLMKEINRYLEHMEFIRGYERFETNYVIYHGKSSHWTGLLFHKFKELAEKTAEAKGHYSKANKDIENFVIRDENDMTFYMLRVGNDIIKTCVPRAQEEEMKQVFQTLNRFVYKQAS